MSKIQLNKNVSEEIFNTTLKTDWSLSYDRKMSYHMMAMFYYGYCFELGDLFDINLKKALYRVKNKVVSTYNAKSEEEAAFISIKEKLLDKNNLLLISKIKSIINDRYDFFKSKISQINLDYSSLSNNELIDEYKLIIEVEEYMSLPQWLLFFQFEEVLTDATRIALLHEITEQNDVEIIISKLSKPSEIIPIDLYTQKICEIILNQNDGLKEKLFKDFEHFGIFDVHHNGADRNFHEEEIKKIPLNKAEEIYFDIRDKYIKQNEDIVEEIEKWSHNKYIYELLNLFHKYAVIKEWKNFYREQWTYKIKYLYQEIAKRLGTDIDNVIFLSHEEMEESLRRGSLLLELDDLLKRKLNGCFMFINGDSYVVLDEERLKEIDARLNSDIKQEIKGSIGYKGLVTGTVKIINSEEDFYKFNEGDILVSGTTRPGFIPVMSKAAAIVTNEGGLLSHAAIVSRELKKPCVIGTKNATQIFKDGDVVEVDAERGIVKKIN